MYDLNLNELYDMTLKECLLTLTQRRKGLAYKMWKLPQLISLGIADTFSKPGSKSNYPNTPEEASPELYPPKKTIKKPKCLYNSNITQRGGIFKYE